MGSEIIIPGTPIGSIPPYDRPNFDPKAQNGFVGSLANLAAPPPGTNVQRYSLQQSANLVFSGGVMKSQAATITLLAGASQTIIGAFTSNSGRTLADLAIFVEGANTTNPVQYAADGKNADLPAGVLFLLPGCDLQIAQIKNNDTVTRTISLIASARPLFYSAAHVSFNLATLAGLASVQLQDILRVRDLTVTLTTQTGGSLAAYCVAAILPRGVVGGVLESSPGRRIRLRAAALGPDDSVNNETGSYGFGYYMLERGPVDILGTDYTAAAWSSPTLDVLLYGGEDLNHGFSIFVSALLDLYVGANQ